MILDGQCGCVTATWVNVGRVYASRQDVHKQIIAAADVGFVSVINSSRNFIARIHCLQILDVVAVVFVDYFLEHETIWTGVVEVTANENRVHVGSIENIYFFRCWEDTAFMT